MENGSCLGEVEASGPTFQLEHLSGPDVCTFIVRDPQGVVALDAVTSGLDAPAARESTMYQVTHDPIEGFQSIHVVNLVQPHGIPCNKQQIDEVVSSLKPCRSVLLQTCCTAVSRPPVFYEGPTPGMSLLNAKSLPLDVLGSSCSVVGWDQLNSAQGITLEASYSGVNQPQRALVQGEQQPHIKCSLSLQGLGTATVQLSLDGESGVNGQPHFALYPLHLTNAKHSISRPIWLLVCPDSAVASSIQRFLGTARLDFYHMQQWVVRLGLLLTFFPQQASSEAALFRPAAIRIISSLLEVGQAVMSMVQEAQDQGLQPLLSALQASVAAAEETVSKQPAPTHPMELPKAEPEVASAVGVAGAPGYVKKHGVHIHVHGASNPSAPAANGSAHHASSEGGDAMEVDGQGHDASSSGDEGQAAAGSSGKSEGEEPTQPLPDVDVQIICTDKTLDLTPIKRSVPALVGGINWRAPNKGEQMMEPWGVASNWVYCTKCYVHSFIPDFKNLHIHTLTFSEKQQAGVSVGSFLRPPACKRCTCPAGTPIEERQALQVCEACKVYKKGEKEEPCSKDDDEHKYYASLEGYDGTEPVRVPEGIYPGWRTRITSGNRHADKAWMLLCPCGERLMADRSASAAERVHKHVRLCKQAPQAWLFGKQSPTQHQLEHAFDALSADLMQSNKYYSLTKMLAVAVHTELSKMVLDGTMVVKVPNTFATKWMEAGQAKAARAGARKEGGPKQVRARVAANNGPGTAGSRPQRAVRLKDDIESDDSPPPPPRRVRKPEKKPKVEAPKKPRVLKVPVTMSDALVHFAAQSTLPAPLQPPAPAQPPAPPRVPPVVIATAAPVASASAAASGGKRTGVMGTGLLPSKVFAEHNSSRVNALAHTAGAQGLLAMADAAAAAEAADQEGAGGSTGAEKAGQRKRLFQTVAESVESQLKVAHEELVIKEAAVKKISTKMATLAAARSDAEKRACDEGVITQPITAQSVQKALEDLEQLGSDAIGTHEHKQQLEVLATLKAKLQEHASLALEQEQSEAGLKAVKDHISALNNKLRAAKRRLLALGA